MDLGLWLGLGLYSDLCFWLGLRLYSWEHTSMLAAGFGFGGAGATLELVKPRLWEASVVVVEPSPSWVCNTVAGRLCTALPAIIGSAVVAKIGAPAY